LEGASIELEVIPAPSSGGVAYAVSAPDSAKGLGAVTNPPSSPLPVSDAEPKPGDSAGVDGVGVDGVGFAGSLTDSVKEPEPETDSNPTSFLLPTSDTIPTPGDLEGVEGVGVGEVGFVKLGGECSI